ncbi:MAG TPA: tRNA methyltransferase [Alphaproteobacteria bacterium]|nr:tRNA methyltransferase [Alphaproteobacteria bacterium]HAJ46216.1 tRNA methyltransferase [Alphaproteobacteria bacterium]
MRIVLFQPDIAANTGTILRMGACLGVAVDIIEPCGFAFSAAAMRRAGMDYIDRAQWQRHASWNAFLNARQGRLVLLSTKTYLPYTQFKFAATDYLILGRESAGVPEAVHEAADARVTIPMQPDARSLNVAMAAAMVTGEALRQTGHFPSSNMEPS